MPSPRFSLIVPAYNAIPHLDACLTSLTRQTLDAHEYEIIVVDDASTDTTLERLRETADVFPGLTVISQPFNSGPGAARNAGLDKARGDWVLFVDSDDELAPTALAQLSETLTSCDKQVDAIAFNWRAISDAPEVQAHSGRFDFEYLAEPASILENFLKHRMDGSVIYTAMRRELLAKNDIRFRSGLREDVDFIFKVYFHARKVAVADTELYLKRDVRTSIINRVSVEHIEGYLNAWSEIQSYVRHQSDMDTRTKYLSWFDEGLIHAFASQITETIKRADSDAALIALFSLINTHLREHEYRRAFLKLIVNTTGINARVLETFMAGASRRNERDVDYLAIAREVRALVGLKPLKTQGPLAATAS